MSPSKKRNGLHLHNKGADNEPNDDMIVVEKEEIAKLTKMAKSWDFTCSFCFKKFPSAQAMGGHQNAHKSERLEEKRLFVRDPIGYRKRAYLRTLKKAQLSAKDNLHAANDKGMSSPTGVPPTSDQQLINAGNDGGNYDYPSAGSNKDVVTINGGDATQVKKNNNLPSSAAVAPPWEELNLVEKIGDGDCAKDGSGSCFDQFNGGVEVTEEVDLTLKL